MTSPRYPGLALVLVFLSLSACKSTQSRDLCRNEALYQRTGFRTAVVGDRPVFVAPVADGRDVSALPASSGGFPITYDADGRWERPVRTMVQELLTDELRESGLFSGFPVRAEAGALVLKPTLVRFHSGHMEMVEGARAMADVALRVQVYGPADAAGRRTLWLDQVYADSQASAVSMVPISTFHLSGRAVRAVLAKVLAGLDGSNVARQGVPIEVPDVPATPGG